MAKGAVWSMKGLIWANSLPLYQEAILRSGVAEEAQVGSLLVLGLSLCGMWLGLGWGFSEVIKLVLVKYRIFRLQQNCRHFWTITSLHREIMEGLNSQ